MKSSLLLLLSMSLSFSLFAEGSKDLYPASGQGYRSFLMSRGNDKTSQPFDPFPSYGVHKVFLKSGEYIFTGSSSVGKGDGSSTGGIRILNPQGTVVTSSFTANTSVGLIRNRTQELVGPNRTNVTGGYTPLVYKATTDGIYEVQFVSFTAVGATDNGTNFPSTHNRAALAVNNSSTWVQPVIDTVKSRSLIAAWDVTVIASDSVTAIPGRVYTRVVNLTGFNSEFSDSSFYGKFYVLTPQGFTYLVENNGQNGASFNFFSNNKGIMPTDNVFTGIPSYTSLNSSSDISKRYWDPRRADSLGVISNKIFYNVPDYASFPDSVTVGYSSYGSAANSNLINAQPNKKTWLKGQLVTPQLSNVVVLCGGVITFESNIDGNFQILIDGNADQKFDHTSDVVINGKATVGVNSITVSSSVLANINAAVGNVGAELKLRLTTAEIHLPFVDVEANKYGTKITRLGGGADASIVFWNDAGLTASGLQKASNPLKNLDGISSLTNGHIWGSSSNNKTEANLEANNFGNNRTLDTWAFVFDEVSTAIRITNCLNLSGNVWNDVNRNATKDNNEKFISGTTSNGINNSTSTITTGKKLYVYLVNVDGLVVGRANVNADGTYSSNALTSNTPNMKLYLSDDSIALGADYIHSEIEGPWDFVSTSTPVGTTVGITGMIALPSASSALANYNFGLRRTPTSGSGKNRVLNLGGTAQVTVPSSTFVNAASPTGVDADVKELLISVFPTNATSIMVNGVLYTSIPNGGIRIPIDVNGNPTVSVSVDPDFEGKGKVQITYNTVDVSGVVSKDRGTALLEFPGNISVNVWNDWNGNIEKSSNEKLVVSNHSNFNPANELTLAQELYAYLVNNTTREIIRKMPLSASGTFEFTEIYEDFELGIVLSTASLNVGQSIATSTLPSGWATTGVNNNGSKTPNANLSQINIGLLAGNLNGIGVGLQRPPIATSSNYTLSGNLAENAIIPLNATHATTTGTLGFLPIFDAESKSTLTLKIQQTPYVLNNGVKVSNTSVLMYNGIEVNQTNFPNLEIPNFDSTKLAIQVKGSGITNVNFDFTVIDAAGASSALASYGFEWISPLPLEFLLFEAKLSNNKVYLEWHTSAERNTKGFDIERAVEGTNWQKIGFVNSNNAFDLINKYHFVDQNPNSGVNQYRIKQIDQDGKFAYSTIRLVTVAADVNIVLTPNPTTDALYINNVSAFSSMFVFNASGTKVATIDIEGNTVKMDVKNYTSGMYKIVFVGKSGTTYQASFIKK